MKVYFVRHGESIHNAARVHSAFDTPLSEVGRIQALTIANWLKDIDIDVIISSDFVRAKETAEIISKVIKKKVELTKLARERQTPSIIHGKPIGDPEIKKLNEEILKKINDPNYRHSDDENFFDTKKRAQELLNYLIKRREENIVVVLHGTILRYIVATMVYGPDLDWDTLTGFFNFKLNNTGITLCERSDDEWKLVTWNDHAHLD